MPDTLSIDFHRFNEETGLLVSVRSAAEAIAALAGGADVVDIKEPLNGPLGAADPETMVDIVRTVGGRVPVTAALGELSDYARSERKCDAIPVVAGVSMYKLGLSGCNRLANWRREWEELIAAATNAAATIPPKPVAVVYADWTLADAPNPYDVLESARCCDCPALLIDTYDKSTGTLFDRWPENELRDFVNVVRSRGIAVVLAGSLRGPSFVRAARLAPELVAVRGAACDSGRGGTVSSSRVHELKCALPGRAGRPPG